MFKERKERTYIKGSPWFKIVWLCYISYETPDDPQLVELWLVMGYKSDLIIGAHKDRQEARHQCNIYNDSWEKDYKSLSKVKGNELWLSLVG